MNEAEKHKHGSVVCHKSRHFSHKKKTFILLCSSKIKNPRDPVEFLGNSEVYITGDHEISEITENTFCFAEAMSTKLIHQWQRSMYHGNVIIYLKVEKQKPVFSKSSEITSKQLQKNRPKAPKPKK